MNSLFLKFKNKALICALIGFFSFSNCYAKENQEKEAVFKTYKSNKIENTDIKDKYFNLLNTLPYHNVLSVVDDEDSSIYLSPFENHSVLLFSKDKKFNQKDLSNKEKRFFDLVFDENKDKKNQSVTYSFIDIEDLSFFDFFDDDYKVEYKFLKSLYDSQIRIDDLISDYQTKEEVLYLQKAFTSINAMIHLIADNKLSISDIELNFKSNVFDSTSRNIEVIALQYITRHLNEVYKINNYKDNIKLTKAIIKEGMKTLYQAAYNSSIDLLTKSKVEDSFYKLFHFDANNRLDQFYLSNPIMKNVILNYYKQNKKNIPNKYEFVKSLKNETQLNTFQKMIENDNKLDKFDLQNEFYFNSVTDLLNKEYQTALNQPNNIFAIINNSFILYGSKELDNEINSTFKESKNKNNYDTRSLFYTNNKGQKIQFIS